LGPFIDKHSQILHDKGGFGECQGHLVGYNAPPEELFGR
jgi:hypothetical protein